VVRTGSAGIVRVEAAVSQHWLSAAEGRRGMGQFNSSEVLRQPSVKGWDSKQIETRKNASGAAGSKKWRPDGAKVTVLWKSRIAPTSGPVCRRASLGSLPSVQAAFYNPFAHARATFVPCHHCGGTSSLPPRSAAGAPARRTAVLSCGRGRHGTAGPEHTGHF